ncbi:sporulation protein [Anaeromicrobium sediminis]|uniref:Sporulation protein n=1 Tax=Anaeromicrobium sediminis TaxID=1478221 RepID=A0A267MKB0_9FIRM|nr:sporulation protein [Anaeromicrobium sediminis]PAB60041.1 hypothetical protein CCE28_06605 [Anaeromicrobium sediminis]
MSFFKKAMASMGMGSAKVDAVLDSERVQAGASVTGKVVIRGGKVEQKVDEIYMDIRTEYKEIEYRDGKKKVYTNTATIQNIVLPFEKVILPKDEYEVPFKFQLSPNTPVSTENNEIWIDTSLDIKKAIDPTDLDYIKVSAHPYIQPILDGFIDLGFTDSGIQNEKNTYVKDVDFIQAFNIIPTKAFNGEIDELKVAFFIKDRKIRVFMEIDKRSGLFRELINADKTRTWLELTEEELIEGTDYIQEKIYNAIKNCIIK